MCFVCVFCIFDLCLIVLVLFLSVFFQSSCKAAIFAVNCSIQVARINDYDRLSVCTSPSPTPPLQSWVWTSPYVVRDIYIVELVTGCYNRTTWLAAVSCHRLSRCLFSAPLSRLRAARQYTHATGDMDLLAAEPDEQLDYWQTRDVTHRTVRLKLCRLWAAMNKRWNGRENCERVHCHSEVLLLLDWPGRRQRSRTDAAALINSIISPRRVRVYMYCMCLSLSLCVCCHRTGPELCFIPLSEIPRDCIRRYLQYAADFWRHNVRLCWLILLFNATAKIRLSVCLSVCPAHGAQVDEPWPHQ